MAVLFHKQGNAYPEVVCSIPAHPIHFNVAQPQYQTQPVDRYGTILDKDFSAATCSGLGQLENGRTFFRYGGIFANFVCNPGFSLLGHVSNSCVRGRWRKPIPVCVAWGCHIPAGIAHGSLHVSHNNAVITVTCKKGYKLVGSLIYCDGKSWNSTIPMCRERDMMDSSLQKKNSEMERTFVNGNSLLIKDPIRISFNITETGHDNTEIARKQKNTMSSYYGQDLQKVWEHQRRLQSLKTFLSFEHEKRQSQATLKELNTEPPGITKYVTSWHSWSTATQIQNSKITERINQQSQLKAILNLTEWNYRTIPNSLGFRDPLRKHSQFVEHEKNAANRSSAGPLKTTTSNIPQATQQVQSQYQSTHLENKKISNANNFLPSLLAVVLETVSKTIPPSSQPYNTTELMANTISEDTYIKIIANATTPAQMLTSITSSLINSNITFSVQEQAPQTPIVELEITSNHTLPIQIQATQTPIAEEENASNYTLPVQVQATQTTIVEAEIESNHTLPVQEQVTQTSIFKAEMASNYPLPVQVQATQTAIFEAEMSSNYTFPVQVQASQTPIFEAEMASNYTLPVQASRTPISEVEMASNHTLLVQVQATQTPIFEADIASNHTLPVQVQAPQTPIVEVEIASNHTSPAQVQATQTHIVEVENANVENINTTSTDVEYKGALIQSTNLSKPSNVKMYTAQKMLSTITPGATSTVTAFTSNSRRNHKNVGILAYKRRVQCVYPPIPSHGTFRFLTIRDPFSNQYPYYIEYSCYPGHTMSTGDVYSFCKDNGEWSGITPVCEDE